VSNRKDNLEQITKHVENSKRLVDEGIITRHSLLKAEVAQSNAERLLKADQNKLEIARMSLNNLLNYSQDTVIVLSDSLQFKLIDISLSQMKEKAKKEQLLLQIAEQKKQLAQYSLDMERADMMPKIFAYANYSFFNEFMPVIMPPFTAGIQLQYTIFNGMSDAKKVKAAKYFNEEVLISKESTEKKIDFWVEKSYLEAEDAKYRYLKLDKTVELAKEHQKIVQRRFDEGIERSVDVVDSHQLYETAQIEQLMTLYEYYIALSNLYFAAGTPEEVIPMISN
jgi:outer membrane protein TolC